MPSFGRIPVTFRRGETPRASELTHMARGVRGLLSDRGGRGINRMMVGGTVTNSLRVPTRPAARPGKQLVKPCQLVLDPATQDLTGQEPTICGYRYHGYDIGVDYGDPEAPKLFESLAPERAREAAGWFDPSPDGHWGWARWDETAGTDGDWILWYAPEERWHVPGTCDPCTPSP